MKSEPTANRRRLLRLYNDEAYEPKRARNAYVMLTSDPMHQPSITDPGPELTDYLRRKRRRILELRIYNALLWLNVVAAWGYVLVTVW